MITPQGQFGVRASRLSVAILAAASAALLSACETPSSDAESTTSKEYFSESEYGVKASPRVALDGANLPQSGGRYHVGKPYKVKGTWYYPKEDPAYVGVGSASWYGSAFHGRLTANGEVYDMTRLTAAHPTMPLPSYARVTNLANGSSVLVRVNDRGPFAHGRVIDLSKRAAELLDYAGAGTAKVKVEYAGRAPVEWRDDQYLLASYRPAGAAPDPSEGLPAGVMVAMNGSTPTTSSLPGARVSRAFASQPVTAPAPQPAVVLPSTGPIVPDRPRAVPQTEVAVLSYADEHVQNGTQAFDKVIGAQPASTGIERWWTGRPADVSASTRQDPAGSYLSIGSWSSLEAAQKQAARLQQIGQPVMEAGTEEAGNALFAVSLHPDGSLSVDEMLRAAWAAGAEDAFAVRQ